MSAVDRMDVTGKGREHGNDKSQPTQTRQSNEKLFESHLPEAGRWPNEGKSVSLFAARSR